MNYLPGLALNHAPPDLCILSSWDYRREPLCPAGLVIFLMTAGAVQMLSVLFPILETCVFFLLTFAILPDDSST
jgi:hypothetical protein